MVLVALVSSRVKFSCLFGQIDDEMKQAQQQMQQQQQQLMQQMMSVPTVYSYPYNHDCTGNVPAERYSTAS